MILCVCYLFVWWIFSLWSIRNGGRCVVTLWSYARYPPIISGLSYQLNKSRSEFNGTRGFSVPSLCNRSLPCHLFSSCVPRHLRYNPIHPPPNNIPLPSLDCKGVCLWLLVLFILAICSIWWVWSHLASHLMHYKTTGLEPRCSSLFFRQD